MKKLCQFALSTVLSSACALAWALGPEPQPLPQPQKLTLGNVKVGHLSAMQYMADDLKQCNVEVTTAEFVRYADARTALLSGSVDVAGIGPADLAIALAQGNNNIVGLTGVAGSPKHLVVRKGVDVKSWNDIAGKRIGIAPGSAVWFQFAATLAENGTPYNSFTPVNIQGGGTAFVQALQRGDVDAVALWEPFESQLVAEGTAYFAEGDGMDYSQSKAVGAELGLLAASRNTIDTKRDALECFLWHYKKREQELAADPERFAQAYAKYTGLPESVTRESVKLIQLGGVLDLDQLRRQAKVFNELGVIPKDVSGSIDQVWDASLLEDVMK
ncbi:ABC transporter substrate-binding protein [Verticiella sediminum]|uniref:ABC transporter substrate-binding protein n=1 Tax=Verticiella sediminum TaxID=1247510 RepID=A0A556AWI0_9BURK|nr:ABC transporter substrate-binding protein [Verticiella sediminum]TSH97308.1 ABC transporter substrate-binding protein [Verticiella sediminum]